MSNWKQNFAIVGVLLLVDAYFLINSLSYPSDSNTFPVILSVLLGIVTIALALQAVFQMRMEGDVRFVDIAPYRGVATQIVLIGLFAFIAPYIGYPVAGFLLCFATACNGGYPNRKVSFIFSVAVSAFVFVVFKVILAVPLPLGILFA